MIVERDGKNGVYNSQGKLLIPCEYDHIDDFMDYCDDESDNFAIIEKDKKYGLLNYKCNIVIPIQYDYLTYFGGDLFIAQNIVNLELSTSIMI
ncbi:WG repeat-containing protein [Campylobacter sp. RM16192]|uniref:WG repeat-containing protein n=1 Tax=Campylobacter sp. RM16192 TaxID=1660080 RepID=UPI001452937B|nr:WG repeat-containing protein [Campylobacter sp. RM16192]QCD51957.1 WG beta repeat domain-containing protein [Campylobacter sp. RM16192]